MPGDLNLQNVFFGLNGLHARKLTWQWKNQPVEDGISYQTWWCSIVMLVFGGVTVTKQKQQGCSGNQSRPPVVCWSKKKNTELRYGWNTMRVILGSEPNQQNMSCHVILMYDWNPGWGARSNIQCMPMNAFKFVVKQTVAANYWLSWVIFWFWWVFFLMTFHPAFEAMKASLCAGGEETTWQQ